MPVVETQKNVREFKKKNVQVQNNAVSKQNFKLKVCFCEKN